MKDDQLKLDLDDNYQQALGVIKQHEPLGSHSSWRIFGYYGTLVLGIRTHFYETDYSYLFTVTLETAEKLVARKEQPWVGEWFDCIKKYKEQQNKSGT